MVGIIKATTGGKLFDLEPQVVALIIFHLGIFAHGTYFSIEISTCSYINKGLRYVVRISLGTHQWWP